jgi:hypothetical protein
MSTTLHQRPPFRAEHLGSLLRPKPLLDERHLLDAKKGDQKKLTAVEDTSIQSIVKDQLGLGFHAVTDGEYRRHMFWYVLYIYSEAQVETDQLPGAHSSQDSMDSKKLQISASTSSACMFLILQPSPRVATNQERQSFAQERSSTSEALMWINGII